jgi:hypothetical protein
MTGFPQPFGVKRLAVIWLLAAVLWAIRLASKPWVWFSVLLTLYSLLGFRLFGRLIPAGIAAIGCAASVWLHMRLYRQLSLIERV